MKTITDEGFVRWTHDDDGWGEFKPPQVKLGDVCRMKCSTKRGYHAFDDYIVCGFEDTEIPGVRTQHWVWLSRPHCHMTGTHTSLTHTSLSGPKQVAVQLETFKVRREDLFERFEFYTTGGTGHVDNRLR